MNIFRMNLSDPRTQLSWLLIFVFLSASFFYKDLFLLKNLAIAVSSTIIFDFIFLKLRRVELFPPAAAITTGVILSIIMPPNSPLELALAGAVAMFSKNFISGAFKLPFIKGGNRHVFNPAGLGALTSAFIFRDSVSWWAASFQPLFSLYFLFLLSPLLVSLVRLRRFWITIPFLILYSLLLFSLNKTPFPSSLLDPTVIFFSLVMLPEPQTTPNIPRKQILFGIFVALAAAGFSKLGLGLDPLILALLTGNLLFYGLK